MAIKPSHILGMNARYRYTKMNPSSAKKYGFSKLLTKELLEANDIPTARIYHVFSTLHDLDQVTWETIPTPFVIKPASGSAGKGVWIIKSKVPDKELWLNQENQEINKQDLDLHVGNILDGEFSTWGSTHKAIVEEMIPVHPALAKYSYKGTPDIRVIVFNSVPVMAMSRIPTKESEGRANLDKGAIGLGIDLATGITTYGLYGKSQHISHFPNSKKKVNGILIPQWQLVLETAVKAANVAGFIFMGADLFIHPERGPMIVELNGFPGLSIQMANKAGLKRRLERVEGIEVRNAQHGVKIAQALFAESFADKVQTEDAIPIISLRPTIEVFDDKSRTHNASAIVDTKRGRSIISEEFADELGLVDLDDLLFRQQEALEGKLPVVSVDFKLKNRKINTAMMVSKRLNKTKHKVELGRQDLQGFLIGTLEE
jgi:alpha-L-glutamate ligase-like protein